MWIDVTTPPENPERIWHRLSTDSVLAHLQSAPDGLTAGEAGRRLAAHGANELHAGERVSPWSVLLDQGKNPLIAILVVATVLSAFLGHAIEAIAIGVIVLFAVLLGFVQEYRAERALEALREMAAPSATVVRDGGELAVAARDLVPGDVIRLRPGDRVPADGRLIEAVNLRVDEAALTGESVPVDKQTEPIAGDAIPLGDRKNMVYGGTAVTYGRGGAVVVATAMRTEFGQIAQMLQTVETQKTPLQIHLDRLGRNLGVAALVVVLVIVGLGLMRGQPFLEMFIFGIALAVAVVPEALPAVVTISLALGVQRMVKRHALVRRLPAVEALGSTSVICSDKTGTLTKNEMTARRIFVAGQMLDVSGSGYEPSGDFSRDGTPVAPSPVLLALLRAAAQASDAHVAHDPADGRWRVKGDPTEGALVAVAAKAGLDKATLDHECPRVNEIPFTSETKRMTTLHSVPSGVVAYTKGAPEVVLDLCATQLTDNGEMPLEAADRGRLRDAARLMAGEALRVLAVAVRPGATLETADRDLTLLGLIGMIDPPRPEARLAVQTCRRAGIRVVMITGDHPLTADAVARELDLAATGRIVTGPELEAMSDATLQQEVEGIDVYARVSPAHKLRVVAALQTRGHIVAMTGDGVNDAPALKQANIGIAMGLTGTDVSREAAAMSLTDDNFASIVAAVEEGRGIFDNVRKYLTYLLSSNIGEIGLVAAASLFGFPLPLNAVQILYVNLATDGLPALALSVDPPEEDRMRRPPRPTDGGIFTGPILTLMLVGGLWSTLVNLGVFVAALAAGRAVEEARSVTFVSLVLIQFFKAYSFRSDSRSVLDRPFANRWLNLAIGWEVALLVLIVHTPFLQMPFGTFGLSLVEWLTVSAVAVTILPVLEMTRLVSRRWFPPATDHRSRETMQDGTS